LFKNEFVARIGDYILQKNTIFENKYGAFKHSMGSNYI